MVERIVLETYNEAFSKFPRGGKVSNEALTDSLVLFFRLGSEWQQEQDKNLYSEEDLRKAFIAGSNSQIQEDDEYGTEYNAYMEEWFEQFRKIKTK